jgi:hypothetical protein
MVMRARKQVRALQACRPALSYYLYNLAAQLTRDISCAVGYS